MVVDALLLLLVCLFDGNNDDDDDVEEDSTDMEEIRRPLITGTHIRAPTGTAADEDDGDENDVDKNTV